MGERINFEKWTEKIKSIDETNLITSIESVMKNVDVVELTPDQLKKIIDRAVYNGFKSGYGSANSGSDRGRREYSVH